MRMYTEAFVRRVARGSGGGSGLHVYYDVLLNTPFFKKSYALRHGSGVLVDLCGETRWWCDPRPATRHDLVVLREALRYTLGDVVFAERVVGLAERGLLMLNTDSGGVLDQVWEFILNGVRLATVYYDYLVDGYVAVPGPGLAVMMLEEGLGGVAEGGGLGGYARVASPSETGVYLVVEGGVVRGSGLEVSPGVVLVADWWGSLPGLWRLEARGSLREAYEANEGYVELLVEKTRRAVEWLEGRLGRRGVLGFSGGKDSLLAMHLLVEAGSSFHAFYSHIEHGDPPHIPGFVERTASRLGVELVMHVNEWGFVEKMLEAFGMPVRGYRWCTQVFKLAPLFRHLRSLGVERVVSYTGSRGFETLRRGLKPATYVDVEHGVLVHSVPYKWPRFLEMLALRYRFRAELPVDYEEGFERISCVTCPNKSVYELRLSERLYPGDWEPWRPYIRRVAELLSPSDWERLVEVHAWRLALQPSELRTVARLVGARVTPRLPGPRRPWRRAGEEDLRRAEAVASTVLGGVSRRGSVFEWRGCRARVEDEHGVWLEAGRFDDCAPLLKALYASAYCAECGVCLNRCPVGAVTRLPLTVDPGRCLGPECRACTDTCPLAWGAVDMALANLYLGYRRALARLRRLREEKGRVYVEKARRLEEEVYRTRGGVERGEGGG